MFENVINDSLLGHFMVKIETEEDFINFFVQLYAQKTGAFENKFKSFFSCAKSLCFKKDNGFFDMFNVFTKNMREFGDQSSEIFLCISLLVYQVILQCNQSLLFGILLFIPQQNCRFVCGNKLYIVWLKTKSLNEFLLFSMNCFNGQVF